MSECVTVSRNIAASSDTLWSMVADVARMGEWSPENEGGEWLGDATAAKPGARFRASNRFGKRSWKTVATVIDAEPARRFSFRVNAGPVKIAEWSYAFDATTNGCLVTESWADLRPGWFKPLSRLASGVSDRPTHNEVGMEQTLERLAAVAEAQP